MIKTQSLTIRCKNHATSHDGSRTDAVTNNCRLHHLIEEPTHALNSSSSCIGLIFTSQPNLVLESGDHLSLHQNCYHHVVFPNCNFSFFYPPRYKRTTWIYEKENAELIWRAINGFDWKRALSNVSVGEKVCYFT